jgi:transcriptional regulator with XRE-family HTH domain
MEKSLKVLGERIRQARKAKGISQETLALESGTDRSYIGGVERGERNPSFKKLCLIAKTVGLDAGTICKNLPLPGAKFNPAKPARKTGAKDSSRAPGG